jgi:hypothetical protein
VGHALRLGEVQEVGVDRLGREAARPRGEADRVGAVVGARLEERDRREGRLVVELDVAALTWSEVRQGEVLGVGPDGLAGPTLELVLKVDNGRRTDP